MSVDEALRTLGIERGLDAAAVRSAYLRQVKLHKPESDPGGFQRVREAYELLRDLGSDVSFGFSTEVAAAAVSEESTDRSRTAPDAPEPFAPNPGVELGAADPGEAFFWALNAEDWERALSLWMRAGARADDVVSDHEAWTLTFSLEAAGDADRAEIAYALWRASCDRKFDARSAQAILRRMAEEYFSRRPYLTADARQMIAGAIVDQDWNEVPSRVMRYRATAGAEARASMNRVIGSSTPALLAVLGLKPPPPWDPPAKPHLSIAFASFVLLIFLRALPHIVGPSSEPERPSAWSEQHRALRDDIERASLATSSSGHRPRDVGSLQNTLPFDGDLPLGFPLGRLRLAVAHESCTFIAATLADIEQDLDRRTVEGARARFQLDPFRSALRRECP